MIQEIFISFCLVLIPLWGEMNRWQPPTLFAVTALTYAVFGVVRLINIGQLFDSLHHQQPSLHDTYFVVHTGNIAANAVLVMAFFAALTWLQTRLRAMSYPRLTKALFWLLHLGIIGAGLFPAAIVSLFLPSQGYAGYSDLFAFANSANSVARIICLGACFGLVALFVWSIAQNRRAS